MRFERNSKSTCFKTKIKVSKVINLNQFAKNTRMKIFYYSYLSWSRILCMKGWSISKIKVVSNVNIARELDLHSKPQSCKGNARKWEYLVCFFQGTGTSIILWMATFCAIPSKPHIMSRSGRSIPARPPHPRYAGKAWEVTRILRVQLRDPDSRMPFRAFDNKQSWYWIFVDAQATMFNRFVSL